MKKVYKIRLAIALIVLILSISAILGFYPFKFLDSQLAALLQRVIYNYSIASVILISAIIIITALFGRFYCSTLCPFGILQEITALISSKIIKKKTYKTEQSLPFKYLIAGLTIGCLIAGSAVLIRYIDPYTIFGSFISLSLFGFIISVIVFILVFFKNRFFCSNVCPVGAILGLISKFSINKIYISDECVSCKMCEKNCPTGAIKVPDVNNAICIKCLKCISICPKGAIKPGAKKVQFNPKRRDFLYISAAIAFVGAGWALGINFAKNTAKKVKNIILPAGAKDVQTMANKCLNCNLCINNCPNKILSKADEHFSTVHIDYSKGEGYCKYDCNNCSSICPSGAIKKLSREEKQNTRIAMAFIKEDCTACGICASICPKKAITIENKKAVIDGSKCIGCGLCAKKCIHDSILISSINKQSEI